MPTMIYKLHPELRMMMPALTEILTFARETEPEPEALAAAIAAQPLWAEAWDWAGTILANNRITGFGGSIYAVPFLDPLYCQRLTVEAERLGVEFGHRPNLSEEPAYQIPELVLRECDIELHNTIADLSQFLCAWWSMIFQTVPKSISTIQFAKYEPNGTAHGNWHNDEDSDFTAVVSLDPSQFKGGGTDLKVSPTSYISVPPLPAGYALLFNGKMIQHRGRAVEAGVRHLLVLWMRG